MTEAEFQQAVIDLARMTGWLVFHDHDSRRNTPGFPDLVLAHPKRGVIFAELKSATGRLRPEQSRWLEVLALAGCETYVWRPADMQAITERLTQ